MTGRRGARSGRGWDAIPPRADAGRGVGRGSRSADRVGPPDEAESPGGDTAGTARSEHDEAEAAREICLRQLAVRPRSRAELAAALARRGISDELSAAVLDRYGEVGMIDDAAFARAWVSSRHHGRGLARRALATELRRRGVDPETAGDALESLDQETEAATARKLVERKLRTATGPPEAVFRRLVGMLARKGYSAGVAIGAVKEALAARGAAEVELAEEAAFAEEAGFAEETGPTG